MACLAGCGAAGSLVYGKAFLHIRHDAINALGAVVTCLELSKKLHGE